MFKWTIMLRNSYLVIKDSRWDMKKFLNRSCQMVTHTFKTISKWHLKKSAICKWWKSERVNNGIWCSSNNRFSSNNNYKWAIKMDSLRWDLLTNNLATQDNSLNSSQMNSIFNSNSNSSSSSINTMLWLNSSSSNRTNISSNNNLISSISLNLTMISQSLKDLWNLNR